MYGRDPDSLLQYFRVVLEVLKHHHATVKLQKCKWFWDQCEFIGVDIKSDGNSPAKLKYKGFLELGCSKCWTDLWMLIGCFGFYSQWLPLYELEIAPWWSIIAKQPKLGTCSVEEEECLMSKLWGDKEDQLVDNLKQSIVSGLVLAHPDPD